MATGLNTRNYSSHFLPSLRYLLSNCIHEGVRVHVLIDTCLVKSSPPSSSIKLLNVPITSHNHHFHFYFILFYFFVVRTLEIKHISCIRCTSNCCHNSVRLGLQNSLILQKLELCAACLTSNLRSYQKPPLFQPSQTFTEGKLVTNRHFRQQLFFYGLLKKIRKGSSPFP